MPHFYIISENLVYIGIHCFLFLLQDIGCECLLELPRLGSSNVYPQSILEYKKFITEMFHFYSFKKIYLYIAWRCFCNVRLWQVGFKKLIVKFD